MKQKKLIAGVSCMIIGVILFLINWDAFEFLIGKTHIRIYPACFFFLAGTIIIVRVLIKKRAAE